ncbi:MAG: BamA/TamA family outer membrane protein [Luteolibacter sp.]
MRHKAGMSWRGWLLLLAVLSAQMHLATATEVQIRGMQSKSENEVLTLIGGRLVYIRGKEATAWRANDAAFMVEEILRNDGFYAVKVRGRVEAKDRIALIVEEGQRLSLGEVTITGDGDAKSLKKTFESPFKSDTPFGAGSPPFRAEDVTTGLDFVTRQLQSQGYWSAAVTMVKQNIHPETGEVSMTVNVDQGPRFKIGQPTVNSPDGRGVKRTATTWEPFIGQWASTENVNGMRAAVEEAFTSRGYPDAEITMTRRLHYDTYHPDFVIRLGVRVKLLNVESEGLKRTKEKRVKQIMQPLEGDWYDEAAMNKKVKDLLATGAFQSVRVETYEVARKRIDATLHFEEAKAKEITLSGGFASFIGPLFRAKYTDRNFRGKLRGFSSGFELSGRGILGETKLTDPWWRGTEVTRTHRLYALIKGYEGYTTYENGYESGWEWDVTDHYSMKVLLGYSYVSVSQDGLPPALLGEDSYNHIRASFTQTWDYRDSPVLPKSGWHLSVPVQIGAAIGDDTNTYTKLGLDGGWYYPLSDSWQLGIGGFAQLVVPSGDINELPIDLRVFNGGARSVRSFPERELGPMANGDPYGGDFSWAVNTEVSRALTGVVQVVGFVDAGGVTGGYLGGQQGELELAAGLGIRLDLPIGPVRLEYGYNLTRDPGEPTGTLHFAIGSTF